MRVLTVKLASLIPCSQVLHFDSETEETDRLALVDFFKGLLEFDPNKRWSPGTDVAQGPLALDARTWHMGPLALDIWDVAKRGDPDPLSRISKLVRWFDEDVGSKRVGVCNIPSPWA